MEIIRAAQALLSVWQTTTDTLDLIEPFIALESRLGELDALVERHLEHGPYPAPNPPKRKRTQESINDQAADSAYNGVESESGEMLRKKAVRRREQKRGKPIKVVSVERRSKLSDVVRADIARRYQAGTSSDSLAEKYRVSAPTILNALRKARVEIRPRGGPRRK